MPRQATARRKATCNSVMTRIKPLLLTAVVALVAVAIAIRVPQIKSFVFGSQA